MRIIFLVLSVFLLTYSAKGQQAFHVMTDKPFYVSGEKMLVSIYNTSSTESEIVYLELLNQKNEILKGQLLKRTGKVAFGNFDLPLSWESDWYLLRAYTVNKTTLAVLNIDYQVVPVYNGFDESPAVAYDIVPGDIVSGVSASFQVRVTPAQPVKDDNINIEITEKAAMQGEHYSLAVMDETTFHLWSFFEKYIPDVSTNGLSSETQSVQVQDQLLCFGKIKDQIGNNLGAFYIPEEGTFSFVSFNEAGVFGIEMPDFYGQKHGQLLNIEPLGGFSLLEPEIIHPSSGITAPDVSYPELPYPQALVDYLELSRKRRIIDDLFDKKVEKFSDPPIPFSSFVKPDKRYVPENYVRFTDIKDFITEVANLIKFRTTEKGEELRLLLEKNKLGKHMPALFLNNFLVTNIEELMRIPIDELERIDIYRREKTLLSQFGILGRNGVVAFFTKKAKSESSFRNGVVVQGLSSAKSELTPIISVGLPTFSPLLYWNGNIDLEGKSQGVFSFELTDDQGTYYVLIQKTSEKGMERSVADFLISSIHKEENKE